MPRGRHADRAGISKSRRVADFPTGMSRPIHDPVGTDGVRVDGTRVSDGSDDLPEGIGAGTVRHSFGV